MNTAPKLHEQIKASLEMAWTYGLGEREFPFEKEAIRLAALAPPSGEGVDNPNVAVLHRIMHYLPDASDRAAVDHAAAELSVLWRHYQRAATQSIDPDSRNFKEGMKVGLSCENMLADKVRNPVCDICGARNAAEAETLCKPSGDNCPGSEWPLSNLWALTTPQSAPVDGDRREFLGKLVRMEWVAWAREQPNAKPSWLLPWEQLTEPEREVDRRIGERIYQVAVIDATTPQSAPVDGDKVSARFRDAFYEMATLLGFDLPQAASPKEVYETKIKPHLIQLTTQPPASQERDGDDLTQDEIHAALVEITRRIEVCGASPELTHASSLACDLRAAIGDKWNKPAEHGRVSVRRALLAASPPSSAAERLVAKIEEATGADLSHLVAAEQAEPDDDEPELPWRPINECPDSDDLYWFLRGDVIDGPRTPASDDADYWDWFAPCEAPATSKPVAEQAKPDDNMQLRARVAGELIAARDTEDGCNRIMALIATLDTYTAQTECVAAMYPAEQAQAWEVWRYIWNPMGMIARDHKQFAESDTTEYVTLADYNALRSRLAGGVTVDDAVEGVNECDADVYIDEGAINIDLCLPNKMQLGLILRPDSTGWAAHGLGYKGHGRHEYGIGDNAFAALVAALGARNG